MKRYHLISTVFLPSILTAACGKPEESAQAKNSVPPPIPVQWLTLKTSTLQDSSEYVGTLEAEQRIALKPQIDGRIQQILVKTGRSHYSGQANVHPQSGSNWTSAHERSSLSQVCDRSPQHCHATAASFAVPTGFRTIPRRIGTHQQPTISGPGETRSHCSSHCRPIRNGP